MRRGAWWLFAALVALGAFLFRTPAINERPMHTDEAVHAVKLGVLLETGEYKYNAHEYHGPVIYYMALPFVWASGAQTFADIPDEAPLRLPIVLCGALFVLATFLAAPGLGRREAFYAAVILAVSPAFSFYSRYYIQEVPFTMFGYLAIAAAWGMMTTHRVSWAVAMGVALGVTAALKETWIMTIGAACLTAVLLNLTSTRRPWPLPFPWRKFAWLFALAIATALFTGLMLLSNFFRNPAALVDAFVAISGYILRGVTGDSSTFGAGVHDHPWYYYFQLLAWPDVDGPWTWTEGLTLLLGVIGIGAIIATWQSSRRPWHFIAIYTILLSAFYSAIPYKTPWNVLPMLTGWCLLAGRGFAAVMDLTGRRWRLIGIAAGIAMMVWPAWLGVQSWRATVVRPADIRNPYAYSATSPNLYRLQTRADQLAALAPEGYDMVIQVFSATNDYWPLPWYLRRFANIGYYNDLDAAHPDAPLIISAIDPDDATRQRLEPRQLEYYGLRAEIVMTTLIRQDLWDAFIAAQESAP